MISDGDLYRLAIFLGSCAMMMIVLYHFLDVNARDETETETVNTTNAAKPAKTTTESTASSTESAPGATGKGR